MTDLVFRDLSGMAEFRAAEDLQRAVWGADDPADPADLMMVIQHEGGLAGGAFQDRRLLGYVFGFPTREPGVQHSHRLAVLAEARGLGLGRRLKFYQRDWCLARGIRHVRWTFDPLRAANAQLNIARLGAGATRYFVDYYGQMEGINRGTPSDRLLADWHLDAAHVADLATGRRPHLPAEYRRVPIPADFAGLLAADPPAALAQRLGVRSALLQAFEAGLAVVGFDALEPAYLLADRATA